MICCSSIASAGCVLPFGGTRIFYVSLHIMMNTDEINKALRACIDDMKAASSDGKVGLDAQVRAYDLLSDLLEYLEYGNVDVEAGLAEEFRDVFASVSERIDAGFDVALLKSEAEARLAELKKEENEARFEAAAAAGLHEFAKETFETWKTGGIFMRRRALRELRERAGFKLESHRIGNYVAKTYDLMNEAYARFARVQQTVFASDVTYKCKAGTYAALNDVLKSIS